MTGLPDKIWAGRIDGFGVWWEDQDIVGNVEYIRKELHDALVASAYETAGDKIWSDLMRHSPTSDYENGYLEGVSAAYKLDYIPESTYHGRTNIWVF